MDHLVDFADSAIVKVHTNQLDWMKKTALNNQKKRYRYCMQTSPDDLLHEMFLVRTRGDYTRPDKHIGISESHTIIEGRELIILFSDDGNIIDAFELNKDNAYLSYRIDSETYHMTIPITDIAIDLEIKPGPFRNDSNVYPEWAPDGSNEEENREFLKKIEFEAKKYL